MQAANDHAIRSLRREYDNAAREAERVRSDAIQLLENQAENWAALEAMKADLQRSKSLFCKCARQYIEQLDIRLTDKSAHDITDEYIANVDTERSTTVRRLNDTIRELETQRISLTSDINKQTVLEPDQTLPETELAKVATPVSFLGVRPRAWTKPRSMPDVIVNPERRISAVGPKATFSLEEFASKAQIQGVQEWYNAQSKTSACTYLIIVLLFATITIVQVVYLVNDFKENPITTSIEYETEKNVKFPQYIQVCFEQFIDPRRVAHYMIETLLIYDFSNTTREEFLKKKIFPTANTQLVERYLTNISNIDALNWKTTTLLLSNGSHYLDRVEQIEPLIRHYANVFNYYWANMDAIRLLFTFLPRPPQEIIDALFSIVKDRLKSTDITITMRELSDLAVKLSFPKDIYADSLVVDDRSLDFSNQHKPFDLNTTDIGAFLDSKGGVCHTVNVTDQRLSDSFFESIQIKVDFESSEGTYQQFLADQMIQVRLTKDGLHAPDYALVEMGTVSIVSFDVNVWDRTATDRCIEQEYNTTHQLLGKQVQYDPTTCRLRPRMYSERESDTNSSEETPCNCMMDSATYMVREPWASMPVCDRTLGTSGLCNGRKCATKQEERDCHLRWKLNDGCKYSKPKCLASDLNARNLTLLVQNQRNSKCLPWCSTTEFTDLATTVLSTIKDHTMQILLNDVVGAKLFAPGSTERPVDYEKYISKIKSEMKSEKNERSTVSEFLKEFYAENAEIFFPDHSTEVNPKLSLRMYIRPRKQFNSKITQSKSLTLARVASDIGGTFGLWLGASIFSIVHLILLLLNGFYTAIQNKFGNFVYPSLQ